MRREIGLSYNKKFGFNVLPLKGKAPVGMWNFWQDKPQSKTDIERMEWGKATGIGVIQGIGDLRLLDLDHVKDYDILDEMLAEIGLDNDYLWVTKSGSGEGLHIIIRVKPAGKIVNEFGDKGIYSFPFKDELQCHHLELRWRNCQTAFPPSKHPETLGTYEFYHEPKRPKELPACVDEEKIISLIKRFCSVSKNNDTQKDEEIDSYYSDNQVIESALELLSRKLTKGSYELWFKIGMSLLPLGKTGEDYFVKMSLSNKNYNDTEGEVRKKFRQLAKDSRGNISLKSLFYIAGQFGWEKPVIQFWKLSRRKVKIEDTRFRSFLDSEGFCKIKRDKGIVFARIERCVVSEVIICDIKDYLMNFINRMNAGVLNGVTRDELLSAIIKSSSRLFTNQFMEFLPLKEIDFVRDNKDEAILFYRNGVVVVRKDGCEIIDYSKFGKYIWKDQILSRDFYPVEERTVFDDFLGNVTNQYQERYLALKSTIGYMLHRFKDPVNAKAIIYLDEKLSDGAFGRSGKGLVVKAILKLRNGVIQDGRNFNIGKSFPWQRIEVNTDILAIEDIGKKFSFPNLFSVITDGMPVEKKNVMEFYLEFSVSPKIILTSNYSIAGIDDSTLDREFVIEFSDFYNRSHRPVDDFGKQFFDGWTTEEWYAFDNFMVGCIQLFLKRGLITYQYANLDRKKLLDETAPEFVEFIETEQNFVFGNSYDKKELFDSFVNSYSDFSKLTQRKFTLWMKAYAKLSGMEMVETRSGKERTITLIKAVSNDRH